MCIKSAKDASQQHNKWSQTVSASAAVQWMLLLLTAKVAKAELNVRRLSVWWW